MSARQGPIIQGPIIQGWCPGALRPMESGDGWVVRVRPHAGRLTQVQAKGIADLASRYGNGLIDLSSRANLQLRGVTPDTHAPLITGLRALGLIDKTAQMESQRNVIVTPFWDQTDGAPSLAGAVAAALTGAPDLPGKFGAALDIGASPVLRAASADIRIERAAGGFLVYADGAAEGAICARKETADAVRTLILWFIAQGGITNGRGRMRALIASGAALPEQFSMAPVPTTPPFTPAPMITPQGALAGIAFGQMHADTLADLAHWPLRITPWRMILAEGARAFPQITGLITTDDPLLRTHACVGAPACKQALGGTRDLARKLASLTAQSLHISGCAKGCAHPGPAALTITATPSGYDIGQNIAASGAPAQTGLDPDALAQWIKTNAP